MRPSYLYNDNCYARKDISLYCVIQNIYKTLVLLMTACLHYRQVATINIILNEISEFPDDNDNFHSMLLLIKFCHAFYIPFNIAVFIKIMHQR